MSKLSKRKQMTLGLFVTIGVLIVIGLVYYLGSKKQWFGDNIRVYTYFYNVSGLQPGNNIRFSGINVGTVKSIQLASDSAVLAEMIISEEASRFIKVDSKAMIESDGLMGNKVITISSGSAGARNIEPADTLESKSPVSLDEVISSFKETSDNAGALTQNLKEISEQIQRSRGLLGKLVADTVLAQRIESTVSAIEQTSENTRIITHQVAETSRRLNHGQGIVPRLLNDSSLADNLTSAMDSLRYASRNLAATSRELETFATRLNNEDGAINLLLTDSLFAKNLAETLQNLNMGTRDLDKVMETVDQSWLLNLFSGKDD
jgi:phospholipid/cholesterol/gamma-HCH transport system substrate-binding protein